MFKPLRIALCSLIFALSFPVFGGEDGKVPLRLEPSKMPYADMKTDYPLWPKEDIVSGESVHRYETLYSGDIDVMIYEADPMKLKLRDYSIDEFVIVISGKLILHADGEEPQHFGPGDSVLVPKGFNGTWEMQGNFREMIVMMNQTAQAEQNKE